MHVKPPILTLPTEILDMTFRLMAPEYLIQLLPICRRIHDIAARLVYRVVRLSSRSARRFFVMISTPTRTSGLYASYVVSLTFESNFMGDVALTFPMMSEALLCLRNIRKLTLRIPSSDFELFMCVMTRRGIIRRRESPVSILPLMETQHPPFSICALPMLQYLRVDRDIRLLAIARYRRIEEVVVMPVLGYDALAVVLENLGSRMTMSSLQAITLRLDRSVDLLHTFWTISDMFKGITKLGIECHHANAMVCISVYSVPHKSHVYTKSTVYHATFNRTSVNLSSPPHVDCQ